MCNTQEAYEKYMAIALALIGFGEACSQAALSIGKILAILVIGVQIYNKQLCIDSKRYKRIVFVCLVYILALFISELVTGTYHNGMPHIMDEIHYMLIMILAVIFIKKVSQVHLILCFLSIGIILDNFIAWKQFIDGTMPIGTQFFRSFYVSVLLMVLPYSYIMLKYKAIFKYEKVIYICSIISTLLAVLVISQVRSGWLALLLSFGIFGFLDTKWRKKLLLGIGIGLFLFLGYAIAMPEIYHRFMTIWDPHWGYNMNRIYVWQSAMAMIADNPLFGIGVGNFKDIYPFYQNPLEFETLAHPHNWLLYLTVENGLCGLAGVAVFYGYVLKKAVNMFNHAENIMSYERNFAVAFLVAFCAAAFLGIYDVTMQYHKVFRVMYFLIGITLAVSMHLQDDCE